MELDPHKQRSAVGYEPCVRSDNEKLSMLRRHVYLPAVEHISQDVERCGQNFSVPINLSLTKRAHPPLRQGAVDS
jgi:hypothetical protein